MMRGVRVAIAAGVGCALVAACSVALDFDALQNGPAPHDAAAFDAHAPADAADAGDSALPIDAGTDAPPLDAPVDARADAPYCASLSPRPLFCDDFDNNPLSAVWDQIGDGQGVAEQSTFTFTSPPRALRIATNPLDAGVQPYAIVNKSFPAFAGTPAHPIASFAVRVDAIDPVKTGLLGVIGWRTQAGAYYNLELSAQAAGTAAARLTLAESSTSTNGLLYDARAFTTLVPLREWHRVTIDATITDLAAPAGANHVKAYLDGVLQVDKALLYAVKTAPIRFELGTSYIDSPSAPWTFFFDDASIDIH